MTQIRPAAVAGMFYAAESAALQRDVTAMLEAAGTGTTTAPPPRVLIAPHAGYIYSGAAAAKAYARLKPWRNQISRVAIMGPAHRVPVTGLGVSSMDAFETPLGTIPIDRQEVAHLSGLPQITVSDRAHGPEHSIEVHLPFLQAVLAEFQVVPLVVGDANTEQVRQVIERWWDADDTLIIISTDLSHFLDYDTARTVDGLTDEWIRHFDYESIGPEHACGCRPLNGMLQLARERQADIERLMLCNSGDTAGSHDRVVGYASYALR